MQTLSLPCADREAVSDKPSAQGKTELHKKLFEIISFTKQGDQNCNILFLQLSECQSPNS